MITTEKINVYKKYNGDIEGWDRFGKKKDKKAMTYHEWELIEELIHGLELIDKKLVSGNYKANILKKLKESCKDVDTENELKTLI